MSVCAFARVFACPSPLLSAGRAAVCFVAAVTAFSAQAADGTNAPGFTYPGHACQRPVKPEKPANVSDSRAVDAYNTQAEAYNKQVGVYSDCIKAYLDNANADIEKIQAKKRAAIDNTY